MSNRYLDEFFSLQCAGDVMNAVAPLHRASKEITESMAVIKRLKPLVLHRPMQLDLVEWCAGNALTSILAAHLLPVRMVTAVDLVPRRRPGHANVNRFHYTQDDIFGPTRHQSNIPCPPHVVIGVHACGNRAIRLIDLYLQCDHAVACVLMPCCGGPQQTKIIPSAFRSRISKYEAWAWWLAERAQGDLFIDTNVLSPCNGVIVAQKGRKEVNTPNG
jgi:hypothetical protein